MYDKGWNFKNVEQWNDLFLVSVGSLSNCSTAVVRSESSRT